MSVPERYVAMIESDSVKSSQGYDRRSVFAMEDGSRWRTAIHRDAYAHQSRAVIERWTGSEWVECYRLLGEQWADDAPSSVCWDVGKGARRPECVAALDAVESRLITAARQIVGLPR